MSTAIAEIQEALREAGLDGWLFFDHHHRDPIAYRVLALGGGLQPTRRWWYLIPAQGEPVGLVHTIEKEVLAALPGEKRVYSRWDQMAEELRKMLRGCGRVAMQYSPLCALPYVATVDAGTVELVRSLGTEVVSSADLVQRFEARWDQQKLESHLEAGRRIDLIRAQAFKLAGERLKAGNPIGEWELAEFIRQRFREEGLTSDHGPIVASDHNSGNPHYEPKPGSSRLLRQGSVLLIDLWAKLDVGGSVYYDSTWVAFCGSRPPEKLVRVFGAVKEARDRTIDYLRTALERGRLVRGYELDDVARSVITGQGYGEFFVHRTGHSIGEDVHGAGANLDNFETRDERQILPWTCFSVEPGIYLPEFGVRLEVDVFVSERSVMLTGEVQNELVLL